MCGPDTYLTFQNMFQKYISIPSIGILGTQLTTGRPMGREKNQPPTSYWRQHDACMQNHFKLFFLLNYLSKSWSDCTIKFIVIKSLKQEHTWIYSDEKNFSLLLNYFKMLHDVPLSISVLFY